MAIIRPETADLEKTISSCGHDHSGSRKVFHAEQIRPEEGMQPIGISRRGILALGIGTLAAYALNPLSKSPFSSEAQAANPSSRCLDIPHVHVSVLTDVGDRTFTNTVDPVPYIITEGGRPAGVDPNIRYEPPTKSRLLTMNVPFLKSSAHQWNICSAYDATNTCDGSRRVKYSIVNGIGTLDNSKPAKHNGIDFEVRDSSNRIIHGTEVCAPAFLEFVRFLDYDCHGEGVLFKATNYFIRPPDYAPGQVARNPGVVLNHITPTAQLRQVVEDHKALGKPLIVPPGYVVGTIAPLSG